MPADAEIKWVHLVRRRISTQCEWRLQFVLSRAGWPHEDCAPDGAVGIDVGWRMLPDGSLRIAYWYGHDGQEGELALPADWLGQMRRVEGIQAHRDDAFNVAKARLARWMKAGARAGILPKWLQDATATLAQWRSCAKLSALAVKWRENRFERDPKAFERLEGWRRRDKHLYEFEGNLRDQLHRRREYLVRKFSCEMRRAYSVAVVEALDLRDFHVLPDAEELPAKAASREHTRDACLSLLLRCIKESMSETVKVPAPDTTRLCPNCGIIGDFPREELVRTCPGCGDKDDQDRVAAINLLRAALGASAPVP
jgi:hypothetical protein